MVDNRGLLVILDGVNSVVSNTPELIGLCNDSSNSCCPSINISKQSGPIIKRDTSPGVRQHPAISCCVVIIREWLVKASVQWLLLICCMWGAGVKSYCGVIPHTHLRRHMSPKDENIPAKMPLVSSERSYLMLID